MRAWEVDVHAAALPAPVATSRVHAGGPLAWSAADSDTLEALSRAGVPPGEPLIRVMRAAEQIGVDVRVRAPRLCLDSPPLRPSPTPAGRPSVVAVVPHRDCERWLAASLSSLVHQTRPPDAIVVIDDASPTPPSAIVERFPTVSLYRVDRRSGPFRLVDAVLRRARFDWVLFQDADDFSCPDRLQTLLDLAYGAGADLVGSQELRIDELIGAVHGVCFPLDVNAALAHGPGHALLHPTSLLSTAAYARVGGFATRLKWGADTEFLLRAQFHLRAVNAPHALYVRRKRASSLTTAPATGLGSPAREALHAQVKAKALKNRRRFDSGRRADTAPMAVAPLPTLEHVTGPRLRE